ncbi:MAG: Rrf2 family transcriptional regulator [Elusimicrobia bacterium]|nr:Rrf2 family transcriptional regulator [Elusimicrobiota bacterium]
MKFFKKNTDYAVRAVMNLAQNRDRFVSSNEISKEENVPLYFMRGILQTLTKKGLILSKEGISGGVKLQTDVKDIRISDLIKMFQGKIELSECMFKNNICPNRSICVIRKRIKDVENKVLAEFNNITIDKLLKDVLLKNRQEGIE